MLLFDGTDQSQNIAWTHRNPQFCAHVILTVSNCNLIINCKLFFPYKLSSLNDKSLDFLCGFDCFYLYESYHIWVISITNLSESIIYVTLLRQESRKWMSVDKMNSSRCEDTCFLSKVRVKSVMGPLGSSSDVCWTHI